MLNLARLLIDEYNSYNKTQTTGKKLLTLLDIIWVLILVCCHSIWLISLILFVTHYISYSLAVLGIVSGFVLVIVWFAITPHITSFEMYIRKKYNC
jgi:membrane protein YdbS with pleckstrin-like domain